VKFRPFRSAVNPAFWSELARRKLHEYKLDAGLIDIAGYFATGNPSLSVDFSSFDGHSARVPPGHSAMRGTLLNVNTHEEFKKADFKQLAQDIGDQVWAAIESGAALEDPGLLTRFFLITFANLKSHHFHYFFLLPSPG